MGGLDALDGEDVLADDLADGVAVGGPDLRHQHVVAAGGVQRLDGVQFLQFSRHLDVAFAGDVHAHEGDGLPGELLGVDVGGVADDYALRLQFLDVLPDGRLRHVGSFGDFGVGGLGVVLQNGQNPVLRLRAHGCFFYVRKKISSEAKNGVGGPR